MRHPGVVSSSVETAVPPSLLRGPAGEADRRAARPKRSTASDALVTGASLTATFLGMLVVQSVAFAGEGEAAGAAGAAKAAAGPTPGEGEPAVAAGASGSPVQALFGGAPNAAGSVLTTGALIDPAALTRLAGGAQFADAYVRPTATAIAAAPEPAPAVSSAVVEASAATAVGLTVAEAPTLPGVPAVEEPTAPDEGLGNIGDHETGGGDADTLVGSDADDHLDGGAGDDVIAGGAGDDSLVGGAGDDLVRGGAGDDLLDGGTGDDLLDGGDGDDRVDGGEGDDDLRGGNGDDELDGGAGNDVLDGNGGTNVLDGGVGDDVMIVSSFRDLATDASWGADGGGIDTVVVNDGYAASVRQELGWLSPDGLATFVTGRELHTTFPSGINGFRQQVHPEIENVSLTGSAAHDIVGDPRANSLWGNEGANDIFGEAGDDRLAGGGGDDRLVGGLGDDVVHGGEGTDLLEGGDGYDLMYGDGGDDVLVLGLNDSAVDTVFDHEGSNTVRLTGADESRVTARLDGDDLRLAYDGHDVAVIDDWAHHVDAFKGLETASGLRPLETFLAEAPQPYAAADLLADFLDGSDAHATLSPTVAQAPAGAVPSGERDGAGLGASDAPAAAVTAEGSAFAALDHLPFGDELWLGDATGGLATVEATSLADLEQAQRARLGQE